VVRHHRRRSFVESLHGRRARRELSRRQLSRRELSRGRDRFRDDEARRASLRRGSEMSRRSESGNMSACTSPPPRGIYRLASARAGDRARGSDDR
jgi:hypothetical protein